MMDVLALCGLALLGLPIVLVVGLLAPPWQMSRLTLALWLTALILPIALMVIADRSPAEVEAMGGNGLLTFFLLLVLVVFFVVVSGVEIVVAIGAHRLTLAFDGALRVLLLGAGYLLVNSTDGQVEVGWNALRSLLPAYACHATKCEDAIVSDLRFGGAFGSPRCGSLLVRLGDPKGGRGAATRLLHPRRFEPGMTAETFADTASLTSLGRGFYHAMTCDEDE